MSAERTVSTGLIPPVESVTGTGEAAQPVFKKTPLEQSNLPSLESNVLPLSEPVFFGVDIIDGMDAAFLVESLQELRPGIVAFADPDRVSGLFLDHFREKRKMGPAHDHENVFGKSFGGLAGL